jgi:hypothetical protein
MAVLVVVLVEDVTLQVDLVIHLQQLQLKEIMVVILKTHLLTQTVAVVEEEQVL